MSDLLEFLSTYPTIFGVVILFLSVAQKHSHSMLFYCDIVGPHKLTVHKFQSLDERRLRFRFITRGDIVSSSNLNRKTVLKIVTLVDLIQGFP